ncbi:MAG: hypothetical protein Q9160_001463 [Pyrenula sp. 1 TL-2023]
MDSSSLLPQIEALDDSLDDLTEVLSPLLATPFEELNNKLPVLERAKVSVLAVYAIESLLFSYLRLNGVAAKDHPVFQELTRVKQYFEKIKTAETGPLRRENLSLDKAAAGRIIKHALAGNETYDAEKAEKAAREKALAKRKRKRSKTDEGSS